MCLCEQAQNLRVFSGWHTVLSSYDSVCESYYCLSLSLNFLGVKSSFAAYTLFLLLPSCSQSNSPNR